MKKIPAAVTLAQWCHHKSTITRHYKQEAIYKRFKAYARSYLYLGSCRRVWTIDPRTDKILYDSNRRDHSPEALKVRQANFDDLPLMMERLKTEEGREELRIRLKKGK